MYLLMVCKADDHPQVVGCRYAHINQVVIVIFSISLLLPSKPDTNTGTQMHTTLPGPVRLCLDGCVKCSSLACLFYCLCSISINPSISPWRQQLSSHMLATYRLSRSWQSLYLHTPKLMYLHKCINKHMLFTMDTSFQNVSSINISSLSSTHSAALTHSAQGLLTVKAPSAGDAHIHIQYVGPDKSCVI